MPEHGQEDRTRGYAEIITIRALARIDPEALRRERERSDRLTAEARAAENAFWEWVTARVIYGYDSAEAHAAGLQLKRCESWVERDEPLARAESGDHDLRESGCE